MFAVKRVCYNCDSELNLDEAVKGQEWLDWANNWPEGEFEGWVHCEGVKEQFIQEDDKELLKVCSKLPLAQQTSYEGSIIVCVACVKSAFENESGIQFKYGPDCGCEDIEY